MASQPLTFGRRSSVARPPTRVNGSRVRLVIGAARPRSVMAFTVTGGRICALGVIAAPAQAQRTGPT
ncbi:hypothetical protein ACSHWO_35725 (plasmid) [Streptomyces sp. HUAS TT3]|uniref:hypothetical protein n=1 Tax=Streptomyces sp. HUAS TT3 TaxID=3447510 RepID=UPI003F65E58B